MKTFDERIEDALLENSEWSGSPDMLWGKISSQIKAEPQRASFRRRPLWFGVGAAATIFLAFMLHTMLSSPALPPSVPEAAELARMQNFSAVMLLPEPEVYDPGEQVELTLTFYPVSAGDQDLGLHLVIWKEIEAEQIVADELFLPDERVQGQDSILVQSPMEPGLYRLVVEGNFVDGDQRMFIFSEKTIRVEGERADEKLKND